MSVRVLFIGGFQKPGQAGYAGGQTFACTSLIESEWGQSIDWVLVDTTAETNDRRSFYIRARGAWRRLWQVWKHLRSSRIDLVLIFCSSGFSFLEKGLMARLAKWRGKPVIFAPRSGLILNDMERSARMKRYIRNTVRRVDRLICQGESWKKTYQELSGEPDEKFVVIHNWIIPDPYLQHIPDPAARPLRSPIRVLFLGWITPYKGVFDLLAAAEKVRNQPVELVLGGKGTHFEEVQSEISRRQLTDTVTLAGWITGTDKLNALRDSDVFVLPSYREGYPNALLEAMSAGLPCVTTAISSIPDLITDGENGFLIEPGDADRMAAIFTQLAADPGLRKRVGTAARQRILSNNTLERATTLLSRAFSELT